jgi:cysteinyl-tRNA synthetase
VKKLAKEREDARKSSDWKKADEIREKINKLGFILEDTGRGIVIKEKK